MNSSTILKWSDVVSPTLTPNQYLINYKDKVKHNFKVYKPKKEVIKKIQHLLLERGEHLNILVLGAEWCPDCTRNLPSMIKILKKMKKDLLTMKILYGVVVNALHKPEDPIWHKSRSPPEAIDPKFNLQKVPTFYFFNKKGEHLGNIIEKPEENSTLEEEMLEILHKSL
jgi:thioredoxin-related protein